MHAILSDVRYAFRQLSKAPSFALTAILTLAIGIGATTAIFTLAYDVLLRPLPYPEPGQLVMTEEQVAEFRDIYPTLPMNANHFVMWAKNSRTIESMAVMSQGAMPLGLPGHPMQVQVVDATPGIFPVLRVAPQTGRGFTAEEGEKGHERVAVLMNDLWRTQFQSDPGIVGKTITLNGFPYTVVGVMPASFRIPVVQNIAGPSMDRRQTAQILVPKAFSKDQLAEDVGDFNYFGLARLRPGVTVEQARADIGALQKRIEASLSADDKVTLSAVVTPFQTALVGDNRKALLILLAAVAGLLLVGCANMTNLLLSRAVGRRRQIAVAAALGASRRDLLRMSMRETALLAAAGGVLGILIAAAVVPFMQQYLPPALDFRGPLQLDWAGAACAVVLSVAATLLAGAVPGWMGSHIDPHDVLHSEARLASESRGSKQLRGALVSVEVAISVTLVLMTGLLVASLQKLMHVDRGFEAERIVAAEVNLPDKSYDKLQARTAAFRQMLEKLHTLPGVEHVGLVSQAPLAGDTWIDMARPTGDARAAMTLPTEHFRWSSPEYLQAIHLPLLAGRYLENGDEGKRLALVSELTARTLWPGQDAVGKRFTRGDTSGRGPFGANGAFTVIGVVKNARTISLARPDPMMVYVPYWYRCDGTASILLRMRGDTAGSADAIRKIVWSVEPEASVPMVRPLGGVVADSVSNRRFQRDLLMLFAVSALLLAGLGVYGVVGYSVAQRQHEIGLRFALGARHANIYALVLQEGMLPVIAGLAAGAAIAFGSARILSSLLYEVSPYNAVIVVGTVGGLLLMSVCACLLPAGRAAAVDPMRALRTD
jgi:predicted permease